MKVQLHRNRAFQMPQLTRNQALTDVASLYNLLPAGPTKREPFKVTDFKDLSKGGIEMMGYGDYADPLSVSKDRLKADFLKKFTGFTGEDPRGEAMRTFDAAEARCKSTNQRIRNLRNGARAPILNAIILMAQRKISYVLGRFDVNELMAEAKWGPGATSSVKGAYTDAVNKFQARPDVSPDFAKMASHLISHLPSWSALLTDQEYGVWVCPLLHVIPGNSVTFVPKTAKTHRIIAVEPTINVFFQMGLGRMIRKRLKNRASVDLDDQGINQALAKIGSIDGSLATIDLASASDTISKELVRELIGEDWFAWLDGIRSKHGLFPNKKICSYEKFSSQGNGFTFDLESLIFWAVSTSVVSSLGFNTFWVNVMGDDIIVPSRCYLRVTRVLQLLGFEVNTKKSFYRGSFRESCGTDYWQGYNVRPVYLKDIPTTPLHWIRISNALRRLAHRWSQDYGDNMSLKAAYEFAVSRVPREFRLKIPDGYGDGGLIVNFDEACPPMARDGWQGYLFEHFSTKSERIKETGRTLVTTGVHQLSEKGNYVPLRDRVSIKKVTSIAFSWSDIGGWVHP